jgi:uncharacterized protein involved in response to NO
LANPSAYGWVSNNRHSADAGRNLFEQFRPFRIAMVLWIGLLSGSWTFATGYGLIAWHAHEFLFGYIGAVVTGFILTAIPNWTGRLPLHR